MTTGKKPAMNGSILIDTSAWIEFFHFKVIQEHSKLDLIAF
jgi:hypothetical protein